MNPQATNDDLATQVSDLTDQLLRSRAEFVNYRRRVEAERATDKDTAVAKHLAGLVGILDDIDRAETHGELVGGLGAVARRLREQLASGGLTRFGEAGDPFDPSRHNAVAHLPVADVDEPVCLDIVAPGYIYNGVLVRVAHVAVATKAPTAEPASQPAPETTDAAEVPADDADDDSVPTEATPPSSSDDTTP